MASGGHKSNEGAEVVGKDFKNTRVRGGQTFYKAVVQATLLFDV